MKKYVLLCFGIIFAIVFSSKGFELKIDRDPFMNLLKYRELKMKEVVLTEKSQKNYLENEAQFIKSSLKVKMVVTSSNDPKAKAALIVGPSGVPIVVVKGSKLRDGVYVKDITLDGIEIEIDRKDKKRIITLKIAK